MLSRVLKYRHLGDWTPKPAFSAFLKKQKHQNKTKHLTMPGPHSQVATASWSRGVAVPPGQALSPRAPRPLHPNSSLPPPLWGRASPAISLMLVPALITKRKETFLAPSSRWEMICVRLTHRQHSCVVIGIRAAIALRMELTRKGPAGTFWGNGNVLEMSSILRCPCVSKLMALLASGSCILFCVCDTSVRGKRWKHEK